MLLYFKESGSKIMGLAHFFIEKRAYQPIKMILQILTADNV